MTYSIVYRTGGTDRCSWRRVGEIFADLASANAFAADTERAGYKTIVRPTAELNALGLPIGWTPAHVDHGCDTIIVDAYRSLHIKAPTQSERDIDRGVMEHVAWYDTSAELM